MKNDSDTFGGLDTELLLHYNREAAIILGHTKKNTSSKLGQKGKRMTLVLVNVRKGAQVVHSNMHSSLPVSVATCASQFL